MGEVSGCEKDSLGWGEVLLDVEGCGEADYAGSVWLQWVGWLVVLMLWFRG